MLNDVAFGQYYPVKSFVHKMDPRVKILALVAYIVALFLAKTFYGLAACFIALALMTLFSRVPVLRVLKSVKAVFFILIFTAVLNLFFHSGRAENLLWHWKFLKIYREGIIFTVFFTLRLFFLVMGSTVLTLSTTPVDLCSGIESLLKPLTLIKIPVHALALVMSIALRFIPTLIEETNRIIAAQKARGADFESGNIFKRIHAIVPILIPLLISAFRRADELADAMDARCYAYAKKRTRYKKLTFGWRDAIGVLLFAALITGVVLFNVYGARILPQYYEYLVLR